MRKELQTVPILLGSTRRHLVVATVASTATAELVLGLFVVGIDSGLTGVEPDAAAHGEHEPHACGLPALALVGDLDPGVPLRLVEVVLAIPVSGRLLRAPC